MQSLISAVVLVLLVILVEPHPICKQTSGPTCYTNLTANVSFLNEWLSLNSESQGLDQLRKHRHNSTANMLIRLTKHDFHDCLETYQSMVTVPQSINATVDTIRDYFNAYLMHKVYVDHLINLGPIELWQRDWIKSSSEVYNVHNNLTKLSTSLNDSVKKLAQLLNNTCSGCTKNCSTSTDKSAALISAMEKCKSPIHSVVNVIVEHSVKLYKIVKKLSKHQSAGVNIEMVDIPSNDIDNLCYCSVRTETA